jgi:hypothetical protein
MRTTFSTPLTPTRESPRGTVGARACTSSGAWGASGGVTCIVVGTACQA